MGVNAFRVEGLRELDAALGHLSKRMGRVVMERALTRAAAPVEYTAKALVSVDTGGLRESISVGKKLSKRQRSRHRKQSDVEVFVGASALPHAHLVEFGTENMSPRPFMRPAWDQHRYDVLDSIAEILGEEIRVSAERAERGAAKRGGKFNTRSSKG